MKGADAGARPRLRAAWRYHLLAWLGSLGVAAAVLALAAVTGRWTPTIRQVAGLVPGLPAWAAVLLLLLVAAAATFLFWGEEFGWTGYLLVRIWPGRPRLAALTAGLIAAVWHYPLALLGYAEYRHLAIRLAGWTAWIVCQEVILAWLRERTGSIWPACLAHAGNNFVLAPITTAMLIAPGGHDDDWVQWLIVLVLVGVAAGPFLRIRSQQSLSIP